MNLRSIDLNLLVLFEALMAERQVTRAANKIGLTQAAMSNALTRLRHALNDELLVRTPSGMEPTPRAFELIGPTRQILRQLERILASEQDFEPSRSTRNFRIRMGDLHEFVILPHLMARIEQEARGLQLKVVHLAPAVTVAALEQDELDFAISTDLPHAKTIRSIRLYDDRIVCVLRAGHPCALPVLSLDAFLGLRHIKISQSPTDTRFVDVDLARQGLQRNLVLHVQHWLAAPHIVRQTDLASIMWERMARRVNEDGGLAICKVPTSREQFTFRLYWHRRYDRHPAHRWLRQLVASVCESLPD